MKALSAFAVSLFAASLLAFSGSSISEAAPVTYEIDPDHSQIMFKVKHLGISTVTGRFDLFEGSYTYDEQSVADSKVETTIKASSVNTNEVDRDDHLKKPEFLNVEKNPDITFKSKKVVPASGDKDEFTIVGDLTINGVTKEVELDAEYGGKVVDSQGNERSAFEAETTINRKDFGINWNKTLDSGGLVVGDEVKIILEVEGVNKKS